jgi:hypothetical protein
LSGPNDLEVGGGGQFHGFESEVISAAEVAATDLEQGVQGASIEGTLMRTGDGDSVLDVFGSFVARKRAKCGVVQDPSGHGILVVAVEGVSEIRLSSEDDAQDQATIHLEIGQDAQDAEHVGSQV